MYEEIIDRLGTMADMTEIIKREGLPPNEATRIRQWELAVLEETEKLRMLKVYRTRKFRNIQPMHGEFKTFFVFSITYLYTPPYSSTEFEKFRSAL